MVGQTNTDKEINWTVSLFHTVSKTFYFKKWHFWYCCHFSNIVVFINILYMYTPSDMNIYMHELPRSFIWYISSFNEWTLKCGNLKINTLGGNISCSIILHILSMDSLYKYISIKNFQLWGHKSSLLMLRLWWMHTESIWKEYTLPYS